MEPPSTDMVRPSRARNPSKVFTTLLTWITPFLLLPAGAPAPPASLLPRPGNSSSAATASKRPSSSSFRPWSTPVWGGGEGALPRHGVQIALRLQGLVGPLNGVGVDGQAAGQGPHRGQLLPLLNGPGDHQAAQAVPHLLIDGPGRPDSPDSACASSFPLISDICMNCISTLSICRGGKKIN